MNVTWIFIIVFKCNDFFLLKLDILGLNLYIEPCTFIFKATWVKQLYVHSTTEISLYARKCLHIKTIYICSYQAWFCFILIEKELYLIFFSAFLIFYILLSKGILTNGRIYIYIFLMEKYVWSVLWGLMPEPVTC